MGVLVGVEVGVGVLVGVEDGVGVLVGVGVFVGAGVGVGSQLFEMTGRYTRRGVSVSASAQPAPLKSSKTNRAKHPFLNRLIVASLFSFLLGRSGVGVGITRAVTL